MQADLRSITPFLASANVQKAITLFGSGLLAHPANASLREQLRSGALSVQDYYSQLLRFVYRLIVRFVAEERSLCFSDKAMPDLAGCELANHTLLQVIRALTFTNENATGRAVEYKNLGAIELGGIYESLLEMRPRVNLDAATFELTFASGNPRKTSGSYYTPGSLIERLLDAVLEPALAEACARPNPQQALLDLKVCDPACGSGLFLIAAAYRMARYLAALRSEGEAPGQEMLRAALREVVSRCIFGVDINPMAVELCRVGLWLETAETGIALSGGDMHIWCGNSLLGATPAVQVRDIPGSAGQDQFFYWHEAFPTVFSLPADGEQPDNEQTGWNGGFDVVLGNPPYIFGENLPQEVKQVFPSIFTLARGQYDTYWLFIEQSLKLVKARGRCALVVPDTLLARDETRAVRELLLQEGLERLYYCGTAFKAHVSTIIFAVAKGSAAREVLYEEIDEARGDVRARSTCSKARFQADPKRRFLTHLSDEEALMLARVENACEPLRTLVKISRGEELGKKDVLAQGPVPIVVGEDIARYSVKPPTRFLETVKKDTWRYAAPRILMLKTGYRCVAALDTVGYVTMQSVYTLHITRPGIAYETLLALLNSRFACWFVYKVFTSYKGLFPQLNQSTIQAIPVPLDIGSRQDELIALVREMMALKKAAAGENVHCRQIEQVDREIDRVIYALYGLNEAEIKLIEQGIR